MTRSRPILIIVAGLLSACGFARFRGVIDIVRNPANLRVVGAFSRDGTRFAAADARLSASRPDMSVVRVWRRARGPDSPATWRMTVKIGIRDLLVLDIAFSPDGHTLALAGLGKRYSIALYDVRHRRFTRLLRGSRPATQTVVFGPDGRWLVSAGVDGRIQVWDPQTGRARVRVAEPRTLLQQSRFPLAVAPDGGWLAYGRTDGRIVFVEPLTGRRIAVHRSGGREVLDLAASPDGRRLAVATDAGVILLDPTDPRPGGGSVLRLATGRVPAIAFFSDGRALVACGELPRQARVYAVPSGRIVYGFEGGSSYATNRSLGTTGAFLIRGPREARIWGRLRSSLAVSRHRAVVRSLVLAFLRSPAIHRVVVSPGGMWVAVFGGRSAHLAITQRHYRLRTGGGVGSRKPLRTKKAPRFGDLKGSI